MYSAVVFLAKHLEIDSLEVTHFTVSCFHDYVTGFLNNNKNNNNNNNNSHPNTLDPELAQIRARHTAEAQQAWGQDAHATAFVLRVLDHVFIKGLFVNGCCTVEEAVCQIHRRLCMLQSIWLENGVWVGDRALQTELKSALAKVMRDVELDWAVC
ncbi:uncharacterized protein B0T15DRAFT_497404 [Chaetomium strumarium]|uniref:Uncharacterized protein n=1 Tax=Chaetomium strumarium TaxID=1170767 RepID=A0AAJ0GKM7_9PEZI|nr:hypothetical protein B0T15DRAFT_497404 [Chaetomium strumarium]